MSVETTAQSHSAIGVTPAAPWRIRALTVLPGYRLALTFNDGRQGTADLSTLLTAKQCGMFEALKDPSFFSKASLEFGVVTWPNGADLDPAWLHAELGKSETWSVPF